MRYQIIILAVLLAPLVFLHAAPASDLSLEHGFATPPTEARLHASWWWLNGNVTPEAITLAAPPSMNGLLKEVAVQTMTINK